MQIFTCLPPVTLSEAQVQGSERRDLSDLESTEQERVWAGEMSRAILGQCGCHPYMAAGLGDLGLI